MANKDCIITQKLLHELYEYHDGNLYNKKYRNSSSKIGDIVGSKYNKGYIVTYINNVRYSVHRLIFMYHHGYLPKFIDHINGKRDDNHIENLREASLSQNACNRSITSTNKSGIKGVHWNNYHKKWTAVCWLNKKSYFVGHFKILEDASKAVIKKRQELHGEFATN